MTKKEKIKILKEVAGMAQNIGLMADQLKAQAARLESDAKNRLLELGSEDGRARKGNPVDADMYLELVASLSAGSKL